MLYCSCFVLLCSDLELKELDNALGFVGLVTSMKPEKYIILNWKGLCILCCVDDIYQLNIVIG